MLGKRSKEIIAHELFDTFLEAERNKHILITIPNMQQAMIHFWHIGDLKAPIMRHKIKIITKTKVFLLCRLNVVPA